MLKSKTVCRSGNRKSKLTRKLAKAMHRIDLGLLGFLLCSPSCVFFLLMEVRREDRGFPFSIKEGR